VEVQIHTFLTSALDWRSGKARTALPRGKNPKYPLNRRLESLWGEPWRFGAKKSQLYLSEIEDVGFRMFQRFRLTSAHSWLVHLIASVCCTCRSVSTKPCWSKSVVCTSTGWPSECYFVTPLRFQSCTCHSGCASQVLCACSDPALYAKQQAHSDLFKCHVTCTMWYATCVPQEVQLIARQFMKRCMLKPYLTTAVPVDF
jgi:hypothetical protein